MTIELIRRFLRLEAASGIILFVMAIFAMYIANSSFAPQYELLVNKFLFVMNDGLMTLFFLVVGIELKRAFIEGELSDYKQVTLPFFAAIGGMLVPALIYGVINYPANSLKGWAVPVATDIAFALGVLSLFGKRVPTQLKLFLMMLAIFDDLGAIIIIAFFYGKNLQIVWLLVAIALCVLLFILNRLSVSLVISYLILGVLLWGALLLSGIHPTLAGVLLALLLPNTASQSPLYRIEDVFHPWVAYFILPAFAFLNAGVSLAGIDQGVLFSAVSFGTMAGLFLGKQLGVFAFSWILIRLQRAVLPENCTWLMFYGVAILCGIGFTMSLFLGTLSFGNNHLYLTEVRLGVLVGSLLSGVLGSLVLSIAFAQKRSHVID